MKIKKEKLAIIINANKDEELNKHAKQASKMTFSEEGYKITLFSKDENLFNADMNELLDFVKSGKSNMDSLLSAMDAIGFDKVFVFDADIEKARTAFFTKDEYDSLTIELDKLINHGTANQSKESKK